MLERLDNLLKRREEIDTLLASAEVVSNPEQLMKLSRERATLLPVVSAWERLQIAQNELTDAKELASDADPEVAEMATEEAENLTAEVDRLNGDLREALLPKDPNDSKNVIMEIRSGAGGDEAALFAGDLFRMYQRYAQRHGLQCGHRQHKRDRTGRVERGGLRDRGNGRLPPAEA